MKPWMTACCVAVAIALPAVAAEKKKAAEPKQAAKKKRAKLEKLACRLGTEDQHARIAVLLADGKVENFAYYSKWKPRTCSMDVKRDDAFSKWVDTGNTTVVTLVEEKGAFLIDHSPGRYHFIFRDIDRMRYCGMEGKVNGTLTIFKGKAQCEVTGVMDREVWEPPLAGKLEVSTPPDVTKARAIPDLRKAAEEEKKATAVAPAASTGTPVAPAAAPAASTAPPAAPSASTAPAAAPAPAPAAATGAPASPPVPQAPARSN